MEKELPVAKPGMITLDTIGNFIWGFGTYFFIETSQGNYEWSCLDYGGDNTISPLKGTYQDWLNMRNIPFGRDKGEHVIEEYCGSYVKILQLHTI